MKQFLKIARLGKSHGVNGGIRIHFEPTLEADFSNLIYVFIKTYGSYVPFFLIEHKSLQKGLVHFEDVADLEEAKKLVNTEVYIEEKQFSKFNISKNATEQEGLLGFTFLNNSLEIGEITKIEAYPQQIMLVINGDNNNDILVPFSEDWIIEIDPVSKIINMELPEGLLDLN